jgi:hypothetical protein
MAEITFVDLCRNEKPTGQRLDAHRCQRVADGVLVIGHRSKMTAVVGGSARN